MIAFIETDRSDHAEMVARATGGNYMLYVKPTLFGRLFRGERAGWMTFDSLAAYEKWAYEKGKD
jgi:hypothetical protein